MLKLILLCSVISCAYSLSCVPCALKVCPVASCPEAHKVKDACGCCVKCGVTEGAECVFEKRCIPGLRCVTSSGCRYQYQVPWEIPVRGTCQKELENEAATPAKCYDINFLRKIAEKI